MVGAKNTISDFDDVPLRQIEFDSRKIEKGDLFLPLKGARDGHDFIETAFENGAVATFSERDVEGHPYILVDDCLEAFQALASYYLEKQRVDVIAVTGSNGKTTTKDMIAAVLSTEYKTYKTQGNYNNEIGLPYTALHMPDDTEAHLEFFGSREKIAKGKLQIVDGMDSDGILIAPADSIVDPYLPESQMVIRFGDGAEIFVKDLQESKDSLTFTTNVIDRPITLPVPGKYNATNAMVAAYVGKLLAISDDDIVEALENIELTRNRTEWKKAANGADILSDVYNANPTAMRLILETFSKIPAWAIPNGADILSDVYNANPTAMRLILETFSKIPANEGGKKIAVLADMKELGEQSVELHKRMIMSLSPETLDTLIFYGEDIAELAQLASQMFPLGKVITLRKQLMKINLKTC